MLARSARVLIGFGFVVAVMLHSVGNLLLAARVAFFRDNVMPGGDRHLLIGMVLGAFVASFIAGAVIVREDPERSLTALSWLTRLLCPVITAPVVLALLDIDFGNETETALVLALLVISLEQLLRISFDAWAERPQRPASAAPSLALRAMRGLHVTFTVFFARPRIVLATVILLAACHAAFMSLWAVWSHERFGTFGYDLGQYDQIFASTLHGRWLAIPALGWPQTWGELVNGHADLGTFYMLPIYAIYPHAPTLLVMQATMLAAASVPLYLFARNHLTAPLAFAIALVWLLYAPLHGAELYDVHMQPFGASWAVFAIAAVDRRRWVLYWVFFTLAILCREDVSMGLAVLGIFLALSGQRVKTGIATAAIATLYFVSLRFVIMTNNAFAVIFKELYAPGQPENFGSIVQTMISNPAFLGKSLIRWEKLRYFAQIFAPLAFLPLRRPILWVLGIPGFILTLMSTGYVATTMIGFQYVSNWAAYMIPATALALSMMPDTAQGRRRRSAAAVTMLVASVISSVQWGAYSPRGMVHGGFAEVPFKAPSELDRQREAAVQDFMAKVADGVPICTSDRLQPHTTSHLDNFTLKDGVFDCEYLMWSDMPGDLGNQRGIDAVNSGTYQRVETRAGVTFARRKAKPSAP
jgi:uncharacterized membrane protein